MPNDSGVFPAGDRSEVTRLALEGLTAPRKTLPPVLFYDQEGCRLFYQITMLPEYYLTRTETRLLESRSGEMIPDRFRDGSLVEFGGSDETKARFLLDQPNRAFGEYVPVDIAGPSLLAMGQRMAATHPWLRVTPVVADFLRPLDLPPLAEARMGFLPGSTLGNLEPREATRFLSAARRELHGGWFLLGADLRKSDGILLPAYNDTAGITAAFNLNMLARLNREAGGDFDLDGFRHEAIWNGRESRIEMHLISRRDQSARLDGTTIRFAEGETIHTENSYKHTPNALVAIAEAAGWKVRGNWADPDRWFGIFLFQAAG